MCSSLTKYPIMQTKMITLYEDFNHFEIMLSPLEKNFGSSFANLLRRTILSYTIGSVVTGIRIKGVSSEFEQLPGLSEDNIQLIMNAKNILIKIDPEIAQEKKILSLQGHGPATLYFSDIICPTGVTIINPNNKMLTLNDSIRFDMDFLVQSGTGYYQLSVEEMKKGFIPVDASFCPIEHVSYVLNNYAHYEEIAFHVRTNGTVSAKESFFHAIEFIQNKLSHIISI